VQNTPEGNCAGCAGVDHDARQTKATVAREVPKAALNESQATTFEESYIRAIRKNAAFKAEKRSPIRKAGESGHATVNLTLTRFFTDPLLPID
jgi:hypothetical protein